MLRLLLLLAVPALAYSGLARADELTIEGMGISRDIDCQGQDVGVYGAENEIAVTGSCGRITVHGVRHKVSFETGTALAVSGSDNTVTGGRVQNVNVSVAQNTVSTTLGGGTNPGALAASGANNRISLVLDGPTQLKVSGVGQVVEWVRSEGAPNPQITASGAEHIIKKKP